MADVVLQRPLPHHVVADGQAFRHCGAPSRTDDVGSSGDPATSARRAPATGCRGVAAELAHRFEQVVQAVDGRRVGTTGVRIDPVGREPGEAVVGERQLDQPGRMGIDAGDVDRPGREAGVCEQSRRGRAHRTGMPAGSPGIEVALGARNGGLHGAEDPHTRPIRLDDERAPALRRGRLDLDADDVRHLGRQRGPRLGPGVVSNDDARQPQRHGHRREPDQRRAAPGRIGDGAVVVQSGQAHDAGQVVLPQRYPIEAHDAVDVLPRDARIVDGGPDGFRGQGSRADVGAGGERRATNSSDDGRHATRQWGIETSSLTSSNSTRTGRSARSAWGSQPRSGPTSIGPSSSSTTPAA